MKKLNWSFMVGVFLGICIFFPLIVGKSISESALTGLIAAIIAGFVRLLFTKRKKGAG